MYEQSVPNPPREQQLLAVRIGRVAREVLSDGAFDAALVSCAGEAGLSVQMLRWGLCQALGQWTEDLLCKVWVDELGGQRPSRVWVGPSAVGLVQARTVPTAGLQAAAWVWLTGAKALVRPARHLRGFWRAWHEAVARHDPGLAAQTEVCCFDRDDTQAANAFAARAQVLVVYGSDDAVLRWRAIHPEVVAHGHRVSAAFISAHALRDESGWDALAQGLAQDVCAWDQRGCLSPACLLVEAHDEADERRWQRLAELWATDALPRVEALLPAGPWSPEVRGARRHFIRSQMVAADLYEGPDGGAMLLYPHDDSQGVKLSRCLHRVLTAQVVRGVPEALARLGVLAPHLSCVGLAGAGFGPMAARFARALAPAGINRVCVIGHMQSPPLGWRHDGQGVLLPLVRAVDLESGAD